MADSACAASPPLLPGKKITRSATFAAGGYVLPSTAEGEDGAAVTIVGDNLTVDFGGATLRGTPATTKPDARKGTGVLVRGNHVTIRNLRVHGYKIGLIAVDSPRLKIENSDFSYNWKQHLQSMVEQEDESDWMSYHQNEKDEWLRYGAGIYLQGCKDFTIKGCRITGGQCGLMLTRCDGGLVANNDFSYLSGIGIGLYRSSNNRVMHNKVDWCVRGYSHGVYNRGQDSAGILVYEQSSRSIFAYNSVTHGGDGFFLWAGQTTMDTGKGGCDDNLIYGNDFSHAPTNGIEMTFSRNTVANNLILECWHGIWGGYSYDTKILGNTFGYNATGIAIEHGRDNAIMGNVFLRDREAVRLWQNKTQDPNWGYPKFHETASRDYTISGNRFETVQSALSIRDTGGRTAFSDNTVTPIRALPTVEASGQPILAAEIDTAAYLRRFATGWNPYHGADTQAAALAPKPLSGHSNAFLKPGALRGRRYILVGEWGPYDFKSPLLWPREEAKPRTDGGPSEITRRFEILGPKGRFRVIRIEGGKMSSATVGAVPGELYVSLPTGRAVALKITLEYVGAATTDYRGIVTPAGKPVRFGYEQFFAPIDWTVRFFSWDAATDPRTKPDAFAARLKEKPLVMLTTDRLEFAGYRFADGVPANYFATVAEGAFEVAPGAYSLEVTTDDGCRAWVDGKPVIMDAWKYQGPTLYKAALDLGTGRHTIRVEHFQIDGSAALKVNLRRK